MIIKQCNEYSKETVTLVNGRCVYWKMTDNINRSSLSASQIAHELTHLRNVENIAIIALYTKLDFETVCNNLALTLSVLSIVPPCDCVIFVNARRSDDSADKLSEVIKRALEENPDNFLFYSAARLNIESTIPWESFVPL